LPARGGRGWLIAAIAAAAAAALAGGLTPIWNADIHWHLAGGQWMLRNFRILDHDIFTIDPESQWVNVHWLFQVIVAILHSAGGFVMLSFAKAVLAGALVLTLVLGMRRRVPMPWLIVCAMGMLIVSAGRIRARPESFTLVFLMLTIVLLEGVRQGSPARRLWWLAPVMLVWVNMHGLFILGLGVIWSAVLGDWLDRKLKRPLAGALLTQQALAPLLAATVICLLTPWPFKTILHPLILWGRISGQAYYYTFGVEELRPTWQSLGAHKEAAAMVVVVAAAMAANWRAAPLAHVFWLAAFAAIAMLALRNLSLAAPVCAFVSAWHGAAVIRRLAARAGALARTGPFLLPAATALAVFVAAAYATEFAYRIQPSQLRFGAGMMPGSYPTSLAKWLSGQEIAGDVLCTNFGDASVFEYHFAAGRDKPVRLLYMDGRLEAHSLERFIDQNNIRQQLRTVTLAERVKLPDGVRFVIVPHFAAETLSALSLSRRFRLARLDNVCACFEDRQWLRGLSRSQLARQLLGEVNLDEFDRPLSAGAGASGPGRRWWRQNPHPLNYQLATMLLYLGQEEEARTSGLIDPLRQRCTLLAIRHMTAALDDGIAPVSLARGALAQAHQQRMVQCGFELSGPLPADVYSARAIHLYRMLDLSDLQDPQMLMFALLHVKCLLQSHQFDAADAAVRSIMDCLPPAQRVNTPSSYLELRGKVAKELDSVEARLAERQVLQALDKAPAAQKAKELVALDIGLIDRAIATLRAAGEPDGETLTTLGDLLLRTGRPGEAQEAYRRAAAILPAAQQWQASLGRALCEWVEGRQAAAAQAVTALAEAQDLPVIRYYQALFGYHAGRYEQSDAALERLGEMAAPAGRTQAAYLYALALQDLAQLDKAAQVFKSIRTDDEELKALIRYALRRLP